MRLALRSAVGTEGDLSVFVRVLAVAWAAMLLSSGAVATTLRISHQFEAEVDARDRGARLIATEAAKRAPGLAITVHPKSSLGIKPDDVFAAVVDGRVEMAVLPLFYASPQVPELAITLLPGMPADITQAKLLKGTGFHRRLQALCESKGFRIVSWWWLKGGIVSSQPEVASIDDMQGVSVRSGDPIFDEMFERVGGTPVVMPSTEIVPAMKAGKLELAQASIESLLSMKMDAVAKSAVIGGNALYVSLHPVIVSTKVWNGLTPAERKAIEEAADLADAEFQKSQEAIEAQAIAKFTAAGVKVRKMEFKEYETWLQLAFETSWASYRKRSPVAEELLASMMQSLMDAPAAKK